MLVTRFLKRDQHFGHVRIVTDPAEERLLRPGPLARWLQVTHARQDRLQLFRQSGKLFSFRFVIVSEVPEATKMKGNNQFFE